MALLSCFLQKNQIHFGVEQRLLFMAGGPTAGESMGDAPGTSKEDAPTESFKETLGKAKIELGNAEAQIKDMEKKFGKPEIEEMKDGKKTTKVNDKFPPEVKDEYEDLKNRVKELKQLIDDNKILDAAEQATIGSTLNAIDGVFSSLKADYDALYKKATPEGDPLRTWEDEKSLRAKFSTIERKDRNVVAAKTEGTVTAPPVAAQKAPEKGQEKPATFDSALEKALRLTDGEMGLNARETQLLKNGLRGKINFPYDKGNTVLDLSQDGNFLRVQTRALDSRGVLTNPMLSLWNSHEVKLNPNISAENGSYRTLSFAQAQPKGQEAAQRYMLDAKGPLREFMKAPIGSKMEVSSSFIKENGKDVKVSTMVKRGVDGFVTYQEKREYTLVNPPHYDMNGIPDYEEGNLLSVSAERKVDLNDEAQFKSVAESASFHQLSTILIPASRAETVQEVQRSIEGLVRRMALSLDDKSKQVARTQLEAIVKEHGITSGDFNEETPTGGRLWVDIRKDGTDTKISYEEHDKDSKKVVKYDNLSFKRAFEQVAKKSEGKSKDKTA